LTRKVHERDPQCQATSYQKYPGEFFRLQLQSIQRAGEISTLTPQQVRVLMILSEGLFNKQIAFQLGVSKATVKAHVSTILQTGSCLRAYSQDVRSIGQRSTGQSAANYLSGYALP
jgi:DNA-binding NarL/FixJ family response regulator